MYYSNVNRNLHLAFKYILAYIILTADTLSVFTKLC